MRFSSYYPSKFLPLKLAKFDPGFSRQAAGGPRGTMSTVVTYRSRAPVRLSQRRLRKGKSHRGRSSKSDWRFDRGLVVYKVDRLTRSLADFAKLVELFDAHGVSFVSVTQQFNTTTSMGRLTLNVLLSFAQFEREVTSERIRDKIAASKRKGLWVGGNLPLGYEMKDGKIAIVEEEA